jgi:hypothetical protein
MAVAAEDLSRQFREGGDQIGPTPQICFAHLDDLLARAAIGDREGVSPLAPAADEHVVPVGLTDVGAGLEKGRDFGLRDGLTGIAL